MNQTPLIQLVDDDSGVRDSLALLIATVGLRVVPWADPQAFVQGFDREAIGAIVLDVRMPGLSGLQVLEQLRNESVDTPVVMLTGHGTVAMCRRAFKGGAAEFLEKPVDDQALLDALQSAVRQHVRSRLRHGAGRAEQDPPAAGADREPIAGVGPDRHHRPFAGGPAAGRLSVDQPATAIVDGLEREPFLILTHPEVLTYAQRKTADYDRWIGGMRRLRAGLRNGEGFLKVRK